MAQLPPHIGCVYLHGFLSSPKSQKAQQLRQYFAQRGMADQLLVPTLPFEPRDAIEMAEQAIKTLQNRPIIDNVFVMGSSLGGYYATYFQDRLDIKAVLINPVVRPYDLFDDYLGPNQHFYDGHVYLLEMKHIEQLKALEVNVLSQPEQLLLMLQTGDGTLDYRLAADKYRGCPSWLEVGGNHSFEGFIDHLAMIFDFAQSD